MRTPRTGADERPPGRPNGRGRPAWTAAAGLLGALAAAGAASASVQAPASAADLASLSIDDLAQIDVSSVSKTDQPLSQAAASVFVITHDDIIRSGAGSLAEALRLAPNLQVAQITATSYAISARGFNGSAADKLLVLIDGRSVYTPFHSGVFWDAQGVPLDTIERIEVVSGPGATLWGANAVNGVINVITRTASQTQGGTLAVGGGNLERRAHLQFGGSAGEQLSYRVYLDGTRRDDDVTAAGADARDDWRRAQAGFRVDWRPGADLVTVQGDASRGSEDQATSPREAVSGSDVVARWTHPTGETGSLSVQAYFDRQRRSVPGFYRYRLQTYDLDLRHAFSPDPAHQVVWGGGYRITHDDFPIVPGNPFSPVDQRFDPQARTLGLGNVFVQDTVTLAPPLKLTLGLKLEKDPYIQLEPLPSARISWQVSEAHMLWAAVSRAIRAPSRLDEDFVETLDGQPYLAGGDFQAETLVAYELGYRGRPTPRLSLSVSAYYNVYSDLRTAELSPGGQLPLLFENLMEGETWGVEAWGAYQATPWWRLSAGYSRLHKDLRFRPESGALTGLDIAGNDPRDQAMLRSMMNLGPAVTLDLDLRRIGSLPSPASPAYAELGARIGWALSDRVELSLTGANLLHAHHAEFGSTSASLQLGAIGVESRRSVSADLRWRF